MKTIWSCTVRQETWWLRRAKWQKILIFSKQLLDASKNTSGENVWKVLKPLLPSKKPILNASTASNSSSLADEFNNLFTNVGSELASKIPALKKDSSTTRYINSCFQFSPVTENEVMKTILGMSNTKINGCWQYLYVNDKNGHSHNLLWRTYLIDPYLNEFSYQLEKVKDNAYS